jgi:hypothetical protein
MPSKSGKPHAAAAPKSNPQSAKPPVAPSKSAGSLPQNKRGDK